MEPKKRVKPTPLTAEALKTALVSQFQGIQGRMSEAAGVNPAQLNRDLSGEIRIPDERFALYIKALRPVERSLVIGARIRDLLPPSHAEAFINGNSDIMETIFAASATLSPRSQSALRWFAQEMGRNPALESTILSLASHLGWRPE